MICHTKLVLARLDELNITTQKLGLISIHLGFPSDDLNYLYLLSILTQNYTVRWYLIHINNFGIFDVLIHFYKVDLYNE